MEESAQCVEFTIDELQALHSVSNIVQVLKICFLYASDEAFHALCSIVMNGKDLSSTSKRIKRDARIELYSKIVATQHPHVHDHVHKRLSYFEFALACRGFSERWSTQFPVDELLSLAILVDKHETEEVTFDGFMEFIEDVDAAFHSNPSYPNDALDALYDGRREALFKHVMVAFTSIDLRNKLAYLSSLASQFHMQPLTALYELTHGDESAETENVIGFVIQLTGAVNQGIKEIEAAREMQLQANRSAFSSPNGSTKSSQSSPRSNSKGSSRSSQRSGQDSPVESINFGPDSDGVIAGSELERTAGSINLSAILAEASHHHDDRHRKDAVEHKQHNHHHRSDEHKGVSKEPETAPLSNPDAVLMSLYAFQNKAQQIAMVLSSSKSASESQPETSADGAAASTNSTNDTTQAALPTLSQAELLLQLQLMEDEIRKAKLMVDPSLATVAASDSSHSDAYATAHHTAGHSHSHHHHGSSHTPSTPQDAPHSSHMEHSEHKAPAQATPSSKQHPHGSTRTPSSSSSVGSSASVEGKRSSSRAGTGMISTSASRRIYASSPRSPRSVHSKVNHSLQDVSFASGGLMNLSLSRSKLDSSGHINRASPLVRHVDLSIFKSPTSHRRTVSRNVFDDAKLTWVSAQSKGAAVKKERFQSTNDLMLAKEVNPVFFSNDV